MKAPDYVVRYSLIKEPTCFEQFRVVSSSRAHEFIRGIYKDIDVYESFYMITLDSNNNVTGYVKIGQGGISGTVADPILIMKYAIESLSKAVILVHNHPSGNLDVSNADKELTRRVKVTLKELEINLLDHLILTKDDYMSFGDDGLI